MKNVSNHFEINFLLKIYKSTFFFDWNNSEKFIYLKQALILLVKQ